MKAKETPLYQVNKVRFEEEADRKRLGKLSKPLVETVSRSEKEWKAESESKMEKKVEKAGVGSGKFEKPYSGDEKVPRNKRKQVLNRERFAGVPFLCLREQINRFALF